MHKSFQFILKVMKGIDILPILLKMGKFHILINILDLDLLCIECYRSFNNLNDMTLNICTTYFES